MKILLDKWQEELIEDTSQYILVCKGRQIGATSAFAEKAAKWMVEKKKKILVGSITEEQAKLIIVMVDGILREKYPKMIKKGKDKPTQTTIRLINGGEIRSRPVGNTGDAFKGFTADVNWFNEMSRWPELAFIAIMPTLLTTGGEMWGDSTPFGKTGFFYNCFLNKDGRWKVYYRTSEEVIYNRPISESWTKVRRELAVKFLEDQKKEMSAMQYGQEYLGLFMEELMRYFDDGWIDKVCTRQKSEQIPKQADCYLGVDIARLGGDETSFEIIQRISKDILIHIYNETQIRWLTTKTEERIMELDRLFSFKKIYIDAGAGSLGVGIFDHLLREDQTKRKVEAINNRKLVLDREGKSKQRLLKEDLYDNLLSLGQKGQITLLDDENVRLSLRSVQYEHIQKTNTLSQMRIFGNYTHIAEGLIRAAWCSKEKGLNFKVSSIRI
jgi:hypothetical protein